MRPTPTSASIIIPNYNYARFLPHAIESALGQTYPATEIIVVDDGSTDGSKEVIASFGPRIQAVLKNNGGHGSAFNAGFARASGDVIFFLDADDAMLPDAVAVVLGAWRAGAVMVHYPMQVIDADGEAIGIYPPAGRQLADGDVRSELLRTGGFGTTLTSGLAFSRSVLDHVMPVPEGVFRQAADGYLVRAAAMFGPVQALNRPLACYRRHGGNDSDLAAQVGDPARFFRKKIAYLRNEYETVHRLAAQLGLPVARDLGEKNPYYLQYRLLSLVFDPAAHPIDDDRRAKLLWRYLVACRHAPDPLRRKVADAVTAFGATILPPAARSTLVRWREVPSTRPGWLRLISPSRSCRMA
jgi:hypothetical protein